MSANTPEPAPVKSCSFASWDLVVADMQERDQTGFKKYGTRLTPFNGRNSLVDAYQEALDLAVYLRTEIVEKEARDERLIAAFLAMRKDGNGLSMEQERIIRIAVK